MHGYVGGALSLHSPVDNFDAIVGMLGFKL